MNQCLRYLILPLLLQLYMVVDAVAENCYMAKDGFAVAQPYMVTRGCFLFHHSANVDLENQSDLVITRPEDLHQDPIYSEFLHFIIDRKLISIKKGTPLFSCDYDLQILARDFKLSGNQGGTSRILSYDLPEFNCAATMTSWAPARPLSESKCFWVAVPLIRCDEYGGEIEEKSISDEYTEEE